MTKRAVLLDDSELELILAWRTVALTVAEVADGCGMQEDIGYDWGMTDSALEERLLEAQLRG